MELLPLSPWAGTRRLARVVPVVSSFLQPRRPRSAVFFTTKPAWGSGDTQPFRQAQPRGAYYDVLLTNPPPYAQSKLEGPPSTAHAAKDGSAVTKSSRISPEPKETAGQKPQLSPAYQESSDAAPVSREERAAKNAEKARIVFGSRLAGPIERANRLAELRKRSQMVAGVLVPPKPDEPENCCMSGCVNCVWDRYRDEMEEWAMASAEAGRRLQAQEGGLAAGAGAAPSSSSSTASPGAILQPPPGFGNMSMDDDGGGSETGWGSGEDPLAKKDSWNEDLYKSVPVGIREFMKQEKRLKLKHVREQTVGG